MDEINWELVQFKYEVLGSSLETLAQEYHLSLPVLKFNSKDWKQIPLAQQQLGLEDISSLEDILTKLGDQTASQAKAFAILKQKFLGPKYVELETVLLHKAVQMASAIKEGDPLGHRTLRSLATVLADLLEQNPLLRSMDDVDGNHNSREWKVTIVDAKEEKEES